MVINSMNQNILQGEPIESFKFGEFTIAGETHRKGQGAGKDILVHQNKVSAWPQRKGHEASLEMIFHPIETLTIEILVIGAGTYGAFIVPVEVVNQLREKGIGTVIIEKTPKACQSYNNLNREGKNVALLAHATC